MMSEKQELDLEAIEATLEAMPRIPRFPAYFSDMRLLVAEVKRLREEIIGLTQALHVAPVKSQLAIANHIFMVDTGLCLEVVNPLAHAELMKIGQQILEGVGQYDIQEQLQIEVRSLREENERLKAENEEFKSLPKNHMVLDLDKSHLVQFPQTLGAVGITQFIDNTTCLFCHHMSHADRGCTSCSCKTGKVKE